MASGSSELGGKGTHVSLPDRVVLPCGPPARGQRLHTPFVSALAIGKIKKVMGSVTITRADVVAQPAVGDPVYEGDLIETGIDGLVSIVFVDGTTFHLDASAHMVLDEFVFAAESSANSALFRVLKGRFSFFSGLLAASGRLIIDTAVARIQNTRPAAGIGGLAFSVFTIGLIHELNAASADIALLDDGTITCKDLKHGVFEIITKGDHPQRFVVDDPCVSVNFKILGSQVQVSEVANTPGQMALFHEAFLGTLNSYLQGQQDPFIRQWQEANAGPQSTGSVGSSETWSSTGLALLSPSTGTNSNLSGSGSGSSTGGSSTTTGGAEIIPVNVIWSGSGGWPTILDWSDGAQPLPIQNVIVDPTKVTFDTTATILGLTVNEGAILNMTGGALTLTTGINYSGFNNFGLIEINSSGADPTLAISGSQSLTGDGAIWLRPPTTQPTSIPAANMIIAVGTSTLTNVNNTIFGSGTIGEGTGSLIGSLTLVNDAAGTIDALGGTLILDTGHVINNSGILAAGLVTPLITTDTTLPDLTNAVTPTGGTLQIDDVVDNAGLIEATAGGILDVKTDLITWTGGTPSAGTNGIWLDLAGTLEVDVAKLQLTGGGAVYMTGGAITGAASTDILENVDNTISGYGTIGGGGLIIVNDPSGIIDANNPSNALVIDNNSPAINNFAINEIINSGMIEATGGGLLTIENTTIDNSTFNPSTNTGVDGYIEALAGSQIKLDNATLLQGFVSTAVGGEISTVSGSSNEIETANGPTHNTGVATIINLGTLAIADDSSLTLASPGPIDNAGAIDLNSSGDPTYLYIDQGAAGLNGGGNVNLSDSTHNIIAVTDSGDQLTNFDNTISGGGEIGAGGMALVNDGTIKSIYSDASLTLDPTTLTNSSLIEAIDDSTLVLSGTTVTNFVGGTEGTIHADSGSTVELDAATIQGGNVTIAGALDSLGSSFIDDGAAITGAGTVTVSSGTLTLSDDNTYTGATTINDGSLALSGSGSIADSIGVTINGTGNLNITAASGNESIITLSGVSGTTVTLGANTLILTDAGGDYEGDISGTGGLTISAGLETLSGTNTYSGTTTIDSGAVLAAGAVDAFSANSAVTDNGELDLGSDDQAIKALNGTNASALVGSFSGSGPGTAVLTISNGGAYAGEIEDGTVSGVKTALTLTGGTLTLNGIDNTYSGTTTIDSGAVLAAGAVDAFSANSAVTDNGELDLGSDDQAIKALNGTNASALVGSFSGSGPGTAVLTISNGGAYAGEIEDGTVSGVKTALTLTGGTLTLNGIDNTYSGTTTIDSGAVLAAGAVDAFSANSAVTDNGELDLGSDDQAIKALNGTNASALVGSFSGSGPGTAVLTISNGGAYAGEIEDGTVSGVKTALTLTGGTLTLNGIDNTYSGTTTIDSGAVLAAGAVDAFSANSAVTDNGELDLGSDDQAIKALNGTNASALVGSFSGSGPGTAVLTISNGGAYAGEIEDGTVSGVKTALTLTGGTLTLNGIDNTYSGTTTIDSGAVLAAGAVDAFSANSAVTDNGELDLGSDDQAIKALNGTNASALVGSFSGSGPGTAVLTISNGGAYAGEIEDGTVSGVKTALTLTGGTLTLNGIDNTYSGTTTIDSGAVLAAGAVDAFSANSAVTDNGELDLGSDDQAIKALNGTNASALVGSFSGSGPGTAVLTISNGGAYAGEIEDGTVSGVKTALTLTGGTLTLNGIDNTYSGTTTIDSGAVLAAGAVDAFSANSAVTDNGELDLGSDDQAIKALNGTNASALVGSFSGSGPGTAVLTISNGGAYAGEIEDGTVSGVKTALTLTGGTLTLNGIDNTYSGTTTIDSGAVLAAGAVDAFSANSAVTDNGELDLGSDDQAIKALNGTNASALVGSFSGSGPGTAVLTISNGGAYAGEIEDGTVSGVKTALTLTGGTLTLNGIDNTYSGTTTIDSGAVLAAGAVDAFSANSAVTDNGELDLGSDDQAIKALNGTNASALVGSFSGSGPGTAVLTISNGGAYAGEIEDGTVSGVKTALTLTGGTLTLNGIDNTYSGTTTIDSGAVLAAGAVDAFSANSAVTDNGELDLGSDDQAIKALNGTNASALVGSFSGSGPGTAVLTISNGGAYAGEIEDGTVSGVKTALTLTGGTLTLNGIDNTYSGTTTIDSGAVLAAGAVDAFSANSAVTDNGELDLGSDDQAIKALNGTNASALVGSFSGSGPGTAVLTISNGGAYAGEIEDGTVSGVKTALTLTGGTLTLNGIDNTYSGTTTIDSGAVLAAGAVDAFSANSAVTDNGELDLGSDDQAIKALNGTNASALVGSFSGSGPGTAVLTISNGGAYAGEIEDGTVSGVKTALTLTGGTLTLNGIDNTYSGTTTIDSGAVLAAGAVDAFSANSAVTDNGELDLQGYSEEIASLAGSSTGTVNLGSGL